MDEPRWVTKWRGLALFLIVAVGAAFIVALLASNAGGVTKLIGVLGVLFVTGGGFIRIWLASRPYGLGAWDQRGQGTTGDEARRGIDD